MAEEKKPERGTAPSSQPQVSAGALTLPITEEQEAAAVAAARAKAKLSSGANALIGASIAGKYKVLAKLGEGGMGTVYRALHTVLEKEVALKVLHGELSHKPELIERFLQEAKAASRIRHENVIDISDFGATEDGHVYFAMELLEGHDLQQELKNAHRDGKLLPWARTKKIFLQICNALSAAHARGIVHRDLKPENVYLVEFLGDPDFVKLLDFGIAKVTDVSASDPDRKLTKTGMLFGTPEYMSPEQARGEKVDQRVDIYAMGCILFQLISNRLPFQAENFMGVLSQHLTEEPPEIAPETFDHVGAPRDLAQVIDVALAKDREERWQSIDEMVTAIHDACGDVLTQGRPKPKRAPSVPSPGETTRMRTPSGQIVPQPQRSNTPTVRARPATAPPPPPAEPAPPRQKRETGIPNDDWKGSVALPDAALEHGAHQQQKQKSMALPAIATIALLGGGVGLAFALGVFDSKPAAKAATADGSGSGSADVVTPPPTPGTPTPALPAKVSLSFSTTPAGASIVEVPGGTVVGKTPFKLTVPGSPTARQYKLVLKGYGEQTIELVPNQASMELTATLVKGGAATTTKAEPRRTEHTTSGTPTTTPENSGAVTRPETTPVTTPVTEPPATPETTPETNPETPPETKPEAKPETPPEAKPPESSSQPPAEPSSDEGAPN